MSAAAIYRQLQLDGSIRRGELSESTVLRFINRLSMEKKMTLGQDMRRYERPHINEVWCGDSSSGPYLKTPDGKRRRVYVIALIDDASRMVVGINVFFNDTFVNLMSVLKSAISKYGVPKVLNFDNGSAYKNRQMELLAARIGSVINYCRPYTPTAKAKIERWFRTMKDQWMASLDMRDFHSLDALRGSLSAFVRSYNLAPPPFLPERKIPSGQVLFGTGQNPPSGYAADRRKVSSGTGTPRFRRQRHCHRRGRIRSGLPLC